MGWWARQWERVRAPHDPLDGVRPSAGRAIVGEPEAGLPVVAYRIDGRTVVTDRLSFEYRNGTAHGDVPSQASLDRLFARADRVCIVAGGLYREEAIGGLILADLDEPGVLHFLSQATRIKEDPDTFHHCDCLGNLVLELYQGTRRLGSLGLHHGNGLRHPAWKHDAVLLDPDRLSTWVDLQGLPAESLTARQPSEQWMADLARSPVERLGLRAESSIRLGDLARAWEYLEAAQVLGPDDPRLDAIVGSAALAGGDPVTGLDALDRARARGLDNAGLQLQRAQALQLLGRLGEAHAAATAALSHQEETRTLVTRAAIAQLMGRDDEVEADFARALELDGENFAVWAQRGGFRGNRRDHAGAESDFTQALELIRAAEGAKRLPDLDQRAGFEATLLKDRATARFGNTDAAGARADLDAIIRLLPDHPQPYLDRGLFLQSRRAHEAAVRDFDRALELQPDHPMALLARAQSRMNLRDHAEALEDLDRLRELHPGDPTAARARVLALVGLGRIDEARWDLREIGESPHDALETASLHSVLERADGRHAAAREALESAFQRFPGHPWACNSLAWLLATCPDTGERDPSRALTLIRRAMKVAKEPRPELLDTLAAALASAGDFAAAAESQQQAIDGLDPQAFDALRNYRSRLALYRSGRPYLSHDPTDD